MRRATALILVAIIAAAQPNQSTGAIEGTVIDSISRAPVRKAQIVLLPQIVSGPSAPRSAMSDSGGSFRFSDLPPGTYGYSVMHAHYPPRPGMPEQRQVEVRPGEAARIDLALNPGAAVSGRIADEDGDPLVGCHVRLQNAKGYSPNMPQGMESSNERGEYRVWGIRAGTYIVAVQCPGPVFQPRPFSAGPQAPPSMAYPVQYYPAAVEAAAAQAIELSAGADRTGVDFRLKPARVFTVSGRVIPPAGRSLDNVFVQVSKKGDSNQRRGAQVNPATGTFEINSVFPGSYELLAGLQNANLMQAAMGARQNVEVTDRPIQMQLALHSAIDIPGTVDIQSENPFPANSLQIQMMAESAMGIAPPPVTVSENGSFIYKGIMPGRWRVTLHGPNVFLKSMNLNGQAVEGRTIEITAGTTGPLHMIASTRTGAIDGTGIAGRNYFFVETDGASPLGYRHMISPGPGGRIHLPGLAPGLYRIYEGDPSGAEPPLKEITIPEGGTVTVELETAK